MRNQSIGRSGFSLLELTVVLAVLAIVAAVALPAIQNVRHEAEVTGTANALSNAVGNVWARGFLADAEGCGGAGLEYKDGVICLEDDAGDAPIATSGVSGAGSRRSEKLWFVFLDRPIETSPDNLNGAGWIATLAGDCESDTSYTYCWDYYVSPEQRFARIRYNNEGRGRIETLKADAL